MFEGKKKYVTLTAIGIIIILAGTLIVLAARALTDTVLGDPWYYLGLGIGYVGSALVSITLIAGALLEEKFNQYVRLGMLIAAGWMLAYLTLRVVV